MNEHDLDDLLREAAPPASVPTDLAARRGAVWAKARGTHRRRVRVGVSSAAAAALLLGGGTMAVAGGDHMTPWGWMADNSLTIERPVGGDCFIGMRVQWDGVSEDDPMVQDARQILSSIDLQSLDITDQLAEARAANETAPELGKRTDEEMRMSAMGLVAASSTLDELVDRGHDMRPGHEVSISSDSTECR